ncbi:hypothetical protein Enr13x_56300 [Stieleria neptunia]|uniref:GTP-binding protein n=1 Tax=Stieleria neptunia TaxID=2527979 RepID=A0A518HY17_9BACT|nr:DUF4416 family protein [Stieleria neptunia]QDV45751.1 hypothetical protein Enr13x_56300 [Stieleria neptunia]
MAEVLYVEPVIRFCAVISGDALVRRRAIEHLENHWGEIFHQSGPLPFEAGGYYAESMGERLQKELIGFRQPRDAAELADWKHWTNTVETQFAAADSAADSGPTRPLNLDPGYITQAKLVLATTKDRDHRVYLRDGMFGEITLTYTAKRWVHHRWTYPDYRTAAVAEFATACRNHLRAFLQGGMGFRQRG